jgi:hypothetical protein
MSAPEDLYAYVAHVTRLVLDPAYRAEVMARQQRISELLAAARERQEGNSEGRTADSGDS